MGRRAEVQVGHRMVFCYLPVQALEGCVGVWALPTQEFHFAASLKLSTVNPNL